MNKIRTLVPINVSSTTAILAGRVISKDTNLMGIGFCIKEGTDGNPTIGDFPLTGIIYGDFPLTKFASTITDLKPNTFYRYRSVAAYMPVNRYIITPEITGFAITNDINAIATGDTTLSVVYTAATHTLLIQGIWTLALYSGTVVVPESMGGTGSQHITLSVNPELLPTTDWAGDLTITKLDRQYFYGLTYEFKTKF